MTTETVQDVLREMRRESEHAGICGNHYADRIERALAGSEPIGEVKLKQNPSNSLERYKVFDCVSPVLICQRYPVGTKFYAHPAIGNKPAVGLWAHIDTIIHALEIARGNATFRMQDAAPHGPTYAEAHSEFVSCNELLALIDSAQGGKGE